MATTQSAQEYLDAHGVEKAVAAAVAQVMRERPTDAVAAIGRALLLERRRTATKKLTTQERREALTKQLGTAASPWEFSLSLQLDDGRHCTVRPVRAGDEPALCDFGLHGLSEESRKMYAPYNWASAKLSEEFTGTIENNRSRRDLHLVAQAAGGRIVAHGFLWAANTPLPELGVAVADGHHGCGLGRCMLLLLEVAMKGEGRRAIELTTMQTNARARKAYESVGYELLGIIRNPVGCDVTAAFAGKATPTHFCDEFQMVRILDEAQRDATLAELTAKRAKATELFGSA
jgi:RimJ/RimL family protein N-acetyltransferase